jgi:flagellar basal-body rod protein FlgF/flagellar basal-body rod protein FlgG
MGSGFYAAFSGWLARSEALDAAASNLANSGTQGFRAEREYFRSALMGPGALGDQLDSTVNNFGVLGGNQLDLGQGALTATGNPLDVAIEGQGFFAIKAKNGIRYTRDGSFQRAANGTLVTSQGEPVLDVKNKPILIPAGTITIGAKGAISVNGAVVGDLGVFSFPSAASITPEGANRFAPVKGAKPKLSAGATIRQGALEGSNQNVIEGTMDLILAQRQAEMMQKALVLFDNDLDKTASEQLPRV